MAPQILTKKRTARWRYIVPNAITCASLVLGLAAIAVSLVAHDFVEASWLIILSVLLDKLDGTAARALGATSDIGVQLDSFSDFVTFGIAPGAMLFAMGSVHHAEGVAATGVETLWMGQVGLVVLASLAAIYILCTCIRLAKFNVLQEVISDDAPSVFYGMPSTFAGGLLALTYIVLDKYELHALRDAMPILAGFFGLMMVSNLPLPKIGKRDSLFLNVVQVLAIAVTFVFGIVRILPEVMTFFVVSMAIGGFTWGFIHRKELQAARRLDPYPDGDEG